MFILGNLTRCCMSEDPAKKNDDASAGARSSLRLPDPDRKGKDDKSWSLLVIFAVVAIVVVALLSNSKG